MKNKVFASLAAVALAFATPVMAKKSAGDTSVDDGTIATSVKGSLLAEKGVPSSDVNVEVYKGVVLLSGFVKTQAEKDAAGKVAKNVKDVASVRNQLVVHPSTSMGTKLDDTDAGEQGQGRARRRQRREVRPDQRRSPWRHRAARRLRDRREDEGDRAIAVAKGVSGVKRSTTRCSSSPSDRAGRRHGPATRRRCVKRPRLSGPLCVSRLRRCHGQWTARSAPVCPVARFRYHARLQFHS